MFGGNTSPSGYLNPLGPICVYTCFFFIYKEASRMIDIVDRLGSLTGGISFNPKGSSFISLVCRCPVIARFTLLAFFRAPVY